MPSSMAPPWSAWLDDSANEDTSPAAPTAPTSLVLGEDGDYELAADGSGNLATAADPIDEQIYFRLATQLGSFSADVAFGNGVTSVTVASSTSRMELRDAVKLALQPMVDAGLLSSVDVVANAEVVNGTGRATYSVVARKTGLVVR